MHFLGHLALRLNFKNLIMRHFVSCLLLVLIGSGCVQLTTDYDSTSYPSEEDFLANDTIAFFLNDFLWLPLGNTSGFKGWSAGSPNTFQYQASYDSTENTYSFRLFPFMNIQYEGERIFSQSMDTEILNVPEEVVREGGTVLLDGAEGRMMQLDDAVRNEGYLNTEAHTVRVLFLPIDPATNRVEALFDGEVVARFDDADVFTVRDGRVTMFVE